MKGILPPTLKMVLKTYYQAPVLPQQQEISSCSQEQQLETSFEVQPDDMTGKYRDRDHNPLERPQVSDKEENAVTDDISSTDQGADFVYQSKVGMNLEASQVTARHFELAIFRHQ